MKCYYTETSPIQFLPLLLNMYPGLQLHLSEPVVLVQMCSQPPLFVSQSTLTFLRHLCRLKDRLNKPTFSSFLLHELHVVGGGKSNSGDIMQDDVGSLHVHDSVHGSNRNQATCKLKHMPPVNPLSTVN